MSFAICLLAVLLTMPTSQQQQPQTPSTSPPYTTSPTFPEGQQMPPDKKAPPPRALSNTEVEQQVKQHLNSEPALANTSLTAKAAAHSVVLTGIVDNESQHDLAMRIAESYSGKRRIVDRIKLRR